MRLITYCVCPGSGDHAIVGVQHGPDLKENDAAPPLTEGLGEQTSRPDGREEDVAQADHVRGDEEESV